MRAKSDIFSVSPKTFRTKVKTSYYKEEKTSQIHCMFPLYQCASYQYALGEVTVDTEERRIKVLVITNSLYLAKCSVLTFRGMHSCLKEKYDL